MNDSLIDDGNSSLSYYWTKAIDFGWLLIKILYCFSCSIVFGCYIYVFHFNKEADKKIPMYPINRHFYQSVIFMQLALYTIIAGGVGYLLAENEIFNLILKAFSILNIVLLYLCSSVINPVHNILLFVLAVRAFLLVLFPERWHFAGTRRAFQYLLGLLYSFAIFVNVIVRVWKIFCIDIIRENPENKFKNEKWMEYADCLDTREDLLIYFYLFTNMLVLSTSVLYCFMFFKVRKISRLVNSMPTKPEKFIFYQTIIIIFTKILIVPLILGNYFVKTNLFIIVVIADTLTTPFVIQISYLICNQAGLEALLSMRIFRIHELIMNICSFINYTICILTYVLINILNILQNILLFVLAVRAFFIVVCPQTWQLKIKRIFEFFVTQERFKFQHLLRFLYFTVVSWCIGIQIALHLDCIEYSGLSNLHQTSDYSNESNTVKDSYLECMGPGQIFFMNFSVSTDLLILSSPILYFFVFLKVLIFPKQESPMKTKPEKLIIYQTIITTFAKIFVVPLIYRCYFVNHFSSVALYVTIVLVDTVTTPFVIQVSYLFCNQSGLGKIWSLQLSKFRRFLLYVFRKRSTVRPS